METPVDRAEIVAEAYRRGILPPEKAAVYEEAARRGMTKVPSDVHALMDANGRERGQGDVRTISNGITFGGARHLDALMAGAETGLHNLASRLTGGLIKGSGYSAGEAVRAVERAQIQQDRQFKAEHPNRALAEEIAGSFLTPGLGAAGTFVKGAKIAKDAGLAAKAGALAVRSGRAAVVGGGIGATSGALQSERPEDALNNALEGGKAGAALGAVAEPALAAGGAMVRRVAKGVRHASDAAQAAFAGEESPRLKARAEASARDTLKAQLDAAGLNPAELARKPHQTVAEALGPSGTSELQTIARRVGTTPEKVAEIISERRASRLERIMEDVHAATGLSPEDARASIEDVIAKGRKEAAPLFQKALSAKGPVWNTDLARIAERPAIRKAMGHVADEMLNAGEDPRSIGLRLDPDTGWTVGGKLGEATEAQPTAAMWDRVHKALAYQIERHPLTNKPLPDTVSPGNFGVRKADQDLANLLKLHVPGYAKALAQSGEYKRVEGAFARAGNKLFARNVRPDEFAAMWATLKTPAEQRAARHAIAAEIFDQAQNKGAGISRFLQPNGTPIPAVRAKLRMAFGKDGADKLIEAIKSHHAEVKFEDQVLPSSGSHTMPMGDRARRQDEESGAAHLARAARAAASGHLSSALAGGVLGFEVSDKKNPADMAKDTALGALGGVALRHGLRASEAVGAAHRNALGDLLLSKPEDLPPLEVQVPAPGYRWTGSGWGKAVNFLAPERSSASPRIVAAGAAARQ